MERSIQGKKEFRDRERSRREKEEGGIGKGKGVYREGGRG